MSEIDADGNIWNAPSKHKKPKWGIRHCYYVGRNIALCINGVHSTFSDAPIYSVDIDAVETMVM